MKKVALFLSVLLVICIGCPARAENVGVLNEDFLANNDFSIGVSNLPWQTSRISLRWWNQENSGREFSIGFAVVKILCIAYTRSGKSCPRSGMSYPRLGKGCPKSGKNSPRSCKRILIRGKGYTRLDRDCSRLCKFGNLQVRPLIL
jgi:hypothetical protein